MERDQLLEARRYDEYLAWLDSIAQLGNERLEGWMSSFRSGLPCKYVGAILYGGYNFCAWFRFDDGCKWLLRMPKQGKCLHRDEKTLREVATIQFLQQHTMVPVPILHAWGLSEDNPFSLGPFLIMDFVEGVTLADLWSPKPQPNTFVGILRDDIPENDLRYVYRQMARFSLDLMDMRFDAIGSLISHDGTVTSILNMKMHEAEARSGAIVGGSLSLCYFTSEDFCRHMLDHAWQQLQQQPNSVESAFDATEKYFNLQELRSSCGEFHSQEEDKAGFRLVCDDLRLHNIMVRSPNDLTIVAIIDWEWSSTAPMQMFAAPPRWFTMWKPESFTDAELDRYKRLLDLYTSELELEESARFGQESAIVPVDPFTDRIPPPPNPCDKRLSWLMKESWTSGRFWYYELVRSIDYQTRCPPWDRLIRQYPYLGTFHVPVDDDITAFIDRKLKERQLYDENWARQKPNHSAYNEFMDNFANLTTKPPSKETQTDFGEQKDQEASAAYKESAL